MNSKIRLFKNLSCALLLSVLSFYPLSIDAFDTFWHSSVAAEAGHQCGFSDDAIKVFQLSSFCLDYFGPFVTEIVGTVEKSVSYLELRDLPSTGATHAASNFMHFDNLTGTLDRNWKFDYLFSRLLDNTRTSILSYYHRADLSRDECKKLILLTVGASIHMVEDFYSHTDWTHFNFTKMGFSQQKDEMGNLHAPTWFEVRKKFGSPSSTRPSENWKFKLCSGVFPPADDVPKSSLGVPLSHTTMNHDNSQLYYSGESQIKFHNFGAVPARDSISAFKHQLYAYHTACAAVIEWIRMIEEDTAVKKAIDYARKFDVKTVDRDLADDLDDGLSSILMLSCIMKKWDGSYPPPERDKECGTFKILPHIHIPKMSNKFWGSFPKDSILQHLSFGIGDSTGHYTFDSLWVKEHHPIGE